MQTNSLQDCMIQMYAREQLGTEHFDPRQLHIRGMAGSFVDTMSIFNRKRNSVKMNISGFAKIFHEQIDEIL